MHSQICLALDNLSKARALQITGMLSQWLFAAKIHDLYDAEGAHAVSELKKVGAKYVWVDAKLHDTKDTVGSRTRALVRNGANIITVHASGGVPMMKAAVDAATSECGDALAEIWGITVLTSLDAKEIAESYGADRTPARTVLDFALKAKEAGLQGVVCSAEEVEMLSKHPDLQGMRLVVPGTRSPGVAKGQQKRSATPTEAMTRGATLVVVGTEVTAAADPLLAFGHFAAGVERGAEQRQAA